MLHHSEELRCNQPCSIVAVTYIATFNHTTIDAHSPASRAYRAPSRTMIDQRRCPHKISWGSTSPNGVNQSSGAKLTRPACDSMLSSCRQYVVVLEEEVHWSVQSSMRSVEVSGSLVAIPRARFRVSCMAIASPCCVMLGLSCSEPRRQDLRCHRTVGAWFLDSDSPLDGAIAGPTRHWVMSCVVV